MRTCLRRSGTLLVLLPLACGGEGTPSPAETADPWSPSPTETGGELPSSASTDAVDSTTSGGSEDGEGSESTSGDGAAELEQRVRASTWTVLEAAPTVSGKQDDVFFVDDALGFVANGPGEAIYRTSDGGASWSPVFEQPGTFFRAVLFLDGQRGFAGNIGTGLVPSVTDDNVLYETFDGGDSWSAVTEIGGPGPRGICNLTAVDSQHVFAIGRANAPSHLLASNDGGASWMSIDLGAWLTMAIDARFWSPDEGIIAGMGEDGRCTVLHTAEGGQSFSPVFTASASSSLCWKLDFPSAEVGYVAIQQTSAGPGAFAKTTDKGLTWQELPLPSDGPYPAIGIGFISEDIGWVVPNNPNQPAFRTFDGGTTWESEPALSGPVNRLRFVEGPDGPVGFASGAQIWKLELAP